MASRVIIGDSMVRALPQQVDIDVFSFSGASAKELYQIIRGEFFRKGPGLEGRSGVLIQVGTNDTLKKLPIEEFKSSLIRIIRYFRSIGVKSIVIAEIPPRPLDFQQEDGKLVKSFNECLRQVVTGEGVVKGVTVKPLCKQESKWPSLYKEDKVHWSDEGGRFVGRLYCSSFGQRGCKATSERHGKSVSLKRDVWKKTL